jgi:putative FmdB family regulatory protein
MPLYGYTCNNCQKQFSEVMTIKERETKKIRCPKCKSEDVTKVIEPFVAMTSKKSSSW